MVNIRFHEENCLKKIKKGIQHQPLAPSQASPPTYYTHKHKHTHKHTHYFKLIVNLEKLKIEAYFKSLQDQINMRINIKPFYFLIKDIDWPYGRDGLGIADWWGKIACGGFANLVCTLLLSSSGQFQWKVWAGQWDSVPVNFLVHSTSCSDANSKSSELEIVMRWGYWCLLKKCVACCSTTARLK